MKKMRKMLTAIATGRKTIRFGGAAAKRSIGRQAASFLAVLLRLGIEPKEAQCDKRWGQAARSGCACDLYVTGLQGASIPDKYGQFCPTLKAKRVRIEKILKGLNNALHNRYVQLNIRTRGPYRVVMDYRMEILCISDRYDSDLETISTGVMTELDCDEIIRGYNHAEEFFDDDEDTLRLSA
jgi:hypothetical protein